LIPRRDRRPFNSVRVRSGVCATGRAERKRAPRDRRSDGPRPSPPPPTSRACSVGHASRHGHRTGAGSGRVRGVAGPLSGLAGGIEAGSGRRGSRARAARDHELGGGADQPREDAEADDIWSHQARPAAHPGAGGVTATPAPQTRESPKVGQTSIGVDNHDRTWCGNG
jgi:hypothetical protein